MRALALTASSGLLLLALVAALPTGQALQQPPQCQTVTGTCCGIEPAFAPCCTLLSCGPVDCVREPCFPQCIVPCVPEVVDTPDLPGAPTFVVCVTEPCDSVVCDHAADQVGPVHYEFTTSCGLVLTRTSPNCPTGPYKTVTAGPLVVRDAACDAADCDYRDATPAQVRTLVWRGACEVVVEPIGACAPPSGRTIEREVLFVRVVLLVCGGGPSPVEWT